MKRLPNFCLLIVFCLFGCKRLVVKQPPAYQLFLGHVEFINSANTQSPEVFFVQILLRNNTDDTLHYINCRGWGGQAFIFDGIELKADSDQNNEVASFALAPHKSRSMEAFLKFVRRPDTSFTLRVGMHFLKAPIDRIHKLSYDSLISTASVIWSDTVRMKTDRKYSTLFRDAKVMKDNAKQVFTPPTEEDRRKYVLSVDPANLLKINKIRNGDLFNYAAFFVPLRLSNRSNDTLKYINFTCDSTNIFITNNHEITITGVGQCLSNFPWIYKLPPHKECVFFLRVFYPQWSQRGPTSFRMGMMICSWGSGDENNAEIAHQFQYFGLVSNDPDKKADYSLWSNEINIPSPK